MKVTETVKIKRLSLSDLVHVYSTYTISESDQTRFYHGIQLLIPHLLDAEVVHDRTKFSKYYNRAKFETVTSIIVYKCGNSCTLGKPLFSSSSFFSLFIGTLTSNHSFCFCFL